MWLLLISIFPKLNFFATRKKTNLCSHYEHKFYARNPQKAEAFLRGKPLPGNTPKARKLRMLIMWIRNFAIYLLWAKQKSILKKRNINIANNFLRFSFFDFFIKNFFLAFWGDMNFQFSKFWFCFFQESTFLLFRFLIQLLPDFSNLKIILRKWKNQNPHL